MNNNYEKLVLAKEKLDKLVGLYALKDNGLLVIPEENVYMEFSVESHDYIAFTDNPSENEEMDMMFARVDLVDEIQILKAIETVEEYDKVVKEFNRILELIQE